MRGLNLFNEFQHGAFLNQKKLLFLGANPWVDFSSNEELGTKVTLLISEDKTDYLNPEITNIGEKLVVKVRSIKPVQFSKLIPMQSVMEVEKVEKATVWGDYNNNLSIVASVKEVGKNG